ncbi:MAG: [acyl-carrier-protein] S-malonyltransferase [Dehalococcoidia bacterium]|nr:MAG: [acyl-carrier-protein] S-malonyltransferase [Dehalococcoidia bacterium]
MAHSPRVAFVFPGQGSQFVGMGKDVYAGFEQARAVFDAADKALGSQLSQLYFEGPEEELRLTVNVQPAIVTFSLAILAVMRSGNHPLTPSFAAGHSLGEYSALAAAGALSPYDAILLARERGKLMYQAGVKKPGAMAAVIGLADEVVSQLAAEAGVYVANYNCPGQIVISGEVKRLEKAKGLATSHGALKVVPLQVSGAFHTSLMQPAADGLAQVISRVNFNAPFFPVIGNASAKPMVSIGDVKDELVQQLTHSVQWQKSIEYLLSQGVETFVEIGPGKVLSGLIKRIKRDARTINIGDAQSLGDFIEKGIV